MARGPAFCCSITLSAREGAAGQAVVCPLLRGSSPTRGVAPKKHRTRRLLTNRPCSSLVYEESDSIERLRVSNWIVKRLYNYAVKKTVELQLPTVFQHVVDPTRVRTVADKNSAMTPLDLRPTRADHVFKGTPVPRSGAVMAR